MKIKSSLFFLILICLFSCTSNRLDVALTHPEVAINYVNIDAILSNSDIDSVGIHLKQLHKKYGSILLYELSHDIKSRITDTSVSSVYQFYQSSYIKTLEKAKEGLYEHLPLYKEKTTLAFQYLAQYFGANSLPKNILFINKLFSGITCGDSTITVGIESYLSPKSQFMQSHKSLKIYQWQKDRMDIQFLARDILFSWIRTELFPDINDKLARHIIMAGKVLYILNACFPNASEAYILRYNNTDYQWAKDNEQQVWHFLVKHQYLFKNDIQLKANFLNRGPATEGLPKEAPDRMGQFIGYHIIKSYMNQNKNVTLQQLLTTKYNVILQSYEIE